MSKVTWSTIAEDLTRRIKSGELEPGSRLSNGEEIAEQWGVSRHTAHRALHELQRQGLVERHRRWGTVVCDPSEPRTGRVAFIVDRFAKIYNFPQADMIQGLQEALGEDTHLIVCECKSDYEFEAKQLRRLQDDVDAIAIYPTAHPKNTPLLQKIADSMPMVVLDRVPEGLVVDSVMSDHEEATLRALHALSERGHRRIGFFSFHKPDFSSIRERYAAYHQALSEAGIDESEDFVRWFHRDLEQRPEQFVQSVYDAIFTLLHAPEPITALFCTQDSLAAASLQACDRLGVSLPGDLELATFNDWPPMMLRRPWQTHRIVQNSYGLGLQAGRLLSARLAGKTEPPQIYRVAAEFFVADAGLQPVSRGTSFPAPFNSKSETNGG